MNSRVYSYRPQGYGDLREATAALIDANGGCRPAADRCRVGKSQLSDYGNPHGDDNKYMPVDVALQLERSSGCRAITEHLAAQHKCILVQLPDAKCSPDWWRHVSETTAEFGDVVQSAGDMLSDGVLEKQEADLWLREVDELLAKAGSLRLALTEFSNKEIEDAPMAEARGKGN